MVVLSKRRQVAARVTSTRRGAARGGACVNINTGIVPLQINCYALRKPTQTWTRPLTHKDTTRGQSTSNSTEKFRVTLKQDH